VGQTRNAGTSKQDQVQLEYGKSQSKKA